MAGKRNRDKVVDRRNEKRASSTREDIKPQKFQEEREARIVPLTAQNENQKKGT
ncbi:phosphate starvation-inducible protein [Vibrio phage vB_VpaM_R16F]|nr:phosphate starvation-inducible protein [Vibrio phage vB_VpaM_R16F]